MNPRRCWSVAVVFGLWACVTAPRDAHAQRATPIRIGRVVDSAGTALARVTVAVDGTAGETTSDARGVFRLALPPGVWTVRGRLIGYAPAAVQVRVDETARDADTIRLVLPRATVELSAISVIADPAAPMTLTATPANVRQLPALGEPDLLRVLPFLPGILQPDDIRSAVYLAGAASDEVGTRLDGFPLQGPTHLNGIFSAVNTSALDRADVLMHHLPASVDGGLGGVIDLWSRGPAAHPEGDVAVSLLSLTATASVPATTAGLDVLASGRVTYAQQVIEHVLGPAGAAKADVSVPSFHDMLGRVSRTFQNGLTLTSTAYATADRQQNGFGTSGVPLGWGESLVGVRGRLDRSTWTLDAHASTDEATVDEHDAGALPRGIGLRHTVSVAGLDIERAVARMRVSGGWEATSYRQSNHWNTGSARDVMASAPLLYDSTASLMTNAAYGAVAIAPTAAWNATIGLRGVMAPTGSAIEPRVLIGHAVGAGWRMDASAERRLQFDAQLGPAGDGNAVAPRFLLDRPRTADMFALTTAWRPTGRTRSSISHLEATVYTRRFPDRPVFRPRAPQDSLGANFPNFTRVRGGASGLALGGVATVFGGALVQGSYTLQSAWNLIDEQRRPADWDIRHSLAAFTAIPLPKRMTLTLAGQVHSGFPITPVDTRVFVPFLYSPNVLQSRYLYGAPNSARIASFRRLDVGVRKSWRAAGASWSISAQAINILARDNPVSYDWPVYFDDVLFHGAPQSSHPGLSFIPSLGLEVRW